MSLIMLTHSPFSTLSNLLAFTTIITPLEELRPVNSVLTTLARSPLHTILTLSATFLADLPRRKCQQRDYKASALPILCPLESAAYGSYKPSMA